MTRRHDEPDEELMDLLFGTGAAPFKAAAAAEEEAEARTLVAEQGRDWEEIITNAMRATGQERGIPAALAAYRQDGTLPRVAWVGVVQHDADPRASEWEMRGSRSGE